MRARDLRQDVRRARRSRRDARRRRRARARRRSSSTWRCVGGPSLPDAIAPAARDPRARSPRRGLTMAAVSGTYNMAHPDRRGARATGAAGSPSLIAAAPRARAPASSRSAPARATPTTCGARTPTTPAAEAWRDMRASRRRRARGSPSAHGVTLAVRARAQQRRRRRRAPARRLLDELRSPRLKVVIDAANLFRPGELARQRESCARRSPCSATTLVLAHAKDVRDDGTIVAAGRGGARLRALRGAAARRRLHRPAHPARPPRGRGARVSAVRPRAPSASGQLLRYGDAAF